MIRLVFVILTGSAIIKDVNCYLPTTTNPPAVITDRPLPGICRDSFSGALLQAIPARLDHFNLLAIVNSKIYNSVTMSCATGTQFNLGTCQCSNFVGTGPVAKSSQVTVPTSDLMGVNNEIGRIYGGSFATVNQFPFAVFIRIFWTSLQAGFRLCTGSLINDRWVITAAHCLWPPISSDQLIKVELFLGHIDVSKARSGLSTQWLTFRRGSACFKHPHFVQDTVNQAQSPSDIALIKMDSPVQLSDAVSAIHLPDDAAGLCREQDNKATTVDGFSQLTVVGWGATEHRGRSDKLLYTQLQVISRDECSRSWPVFPVQFCAYGIPRGVSDTCRGDSGGPTIVTINGTDYITGIVSFGGKCADPTTPALYTRVCPFIQWIRKTINA